MWEDRFRVLESMLERGEDHEAPWARSICATLPFEASLLGVKREQMVPGTWLSWSRQSPSGAATAELALPGDFVLQSWGHVAIGYTSPTRSTLGMNALQLMARDFLSHRRTTAPRSTEALTRALLDEGDALRRWLRRCQAGVNAPPHTGSALIEALFRESDASYDGVVVSENLVFELLDRINDHGRAMRRARVVYLDPTIVNDHPLAYFSPNDPASGEATAAARRFAAFLRTAELQTKAVELGFRPTNPRVTIRSFAIRNNPFLRSRNFGVQLEMTQRETPALTGAALADLVDLWEDATGRH
jgi:hypothetical protein